MPEPVPCIRAGSLPGRLVVILHDGSVLGVCRRAIEDPFLGRVLGFAYEDDEWYEGPKFIPMHAVAGFGESAILLDQRSELLELHQAAEIRLILRQREGFLEKHVMTEAGKYLGEIFDYEFDRQGRVTSYFIHRYLAGEAAAYQLPAERTARVGKNLVLVTEGALLATDLAPAIRAPWEAVGHPQLTPTVRTLEALKHQSPEPQVARRAALESPRPRPVGIPVPQDTLSDRFNQRQHAYLLGRRCERDVADDHGQLLVGRGQLIDEQVIREAQAAGKFMELAISSRTAGVVQERVA